jgi:hypothetical protein
MRRLLTIRRVFVTVFLLGLLTMACRAIHDRDLWWHLRTGQLILQNHAVFHTDPFSFTRKGSPWINQEWLSEVLIYSLYRVAGFGGLIVSFGALSALTIYLAFLRSPGKPYIAAIVALWGAAAFAPTWGVRPITLSLLLAATFLLLLEKSASQPNVLWWMVPLTLLWVNLHGEFALGIGLMLVFLLGIALDAAFGFASWATVKPQIRRLTLVTLASVAVVPLNPNGLKMYLYPIETLRYTALPRYIDEWFSPNFHQHRQLPLLFMILGILASLGLSRKKLSPREILLLTVGTAAALHSVRHAGIFVLVVIPILSSLIESALEQRGWSLRPESVQATSAKLMINAMILTACLGFAAIHIHEVIQEQVKSEASTLPVGAVSFITANHPPGPMLNDYNWGGYLIWKLGPDFPVYVDGRSDLYGDAFLDEFAATYYVRGDWRRGLEQWHIGTVLLPPNAPLISVLKMEPGWNQVYADSTAVILVRSAPQ